MHTAAIRRIDVDAAERFLVTASHDKTARVWDLANGQLLQVLSLGSTADLVRFAIKQHIVPE